MKKLDLSLPKVLYFGMLMGLAGCSSGGLDEVIKPEVKTEYIKNNAPQIPLAKSFSFQIPIVNVNSNDIFLPDYFF